MKENEWVSIHDRLPKIGEEVSIVYNITDAEVISPFDIYKNYIMAYDDNTYQWHHNFLKGIITHWRPIPEKCPDFSKLRQGDLVLLYDVHKNEYLAYFKCIDKDGDIQIFFKNCYVEKIDFSSVEKITRINLETQQFEEI